MLHEPAAQESGVDHASAYKSSLGIKMFVVYGLIYAGFVGITTFSPETMKAKVFLGLNLAITYGFALIILAIVFGVIYNHLCTKKEDELNKIEEESK